MAYVIGFGVLCNMTALDQANSQPVSVIQDPVSYESRLQERAISQITLVVVHCTELPDLKTARQYAETIHYDRSQTGNSGHYYVDREGKVVQYVSNNRVAHHVKGHNEFSIGIELVNLGRYPDWYHSQSQEMTENYTEEQLEALGALLRQLEGSLPALEYIAGHEDLDRQQVPASDLERVSVQRKMDPGPLFPWSEIMSSTGLKRYRP